LATINPTSTFAQMVSSSLHHLPTPSLPILASRMSFAQTQLSNPTGGPYSMLSIPHRNLIHPM
jgi:hypothetical protein